MLEQGHQSVDGGSHGQRHPVVNAHDGRRATFADLDTSDDVDAVVPAASLTPLVRARDTLRTGRETQAGSVGIVDRTAIVTAMPYAYPVSGSAARASRWTPVERTHVEHVSSEITRAPRKDGHRTLFGDR